MSTSPHLVSRRALLQGGIALGGTALFGGLLSACSSSKSSSGAKSTQVGGTLVFAGFQGYDALAPTKGWRAQHHVNLKSIYVSDNNETGTKVVAAAKAGQQLDLIVYQQGFTAVFEQEKILQPIDVSRISNYKGLDPIFRSDYKHFWKDADGTTRGIPLLFYSQGIIYDSAQLPTAPTSYDVLLDPKWKGKVTVTDDVQGVYLTAARAVGIKDPANLTSDDLSKIEDWVRALLKQTRGVAPTYGDMVTRLAAGDVAMALPGWPGMIELVAKAGRNSIRSAIPAEGGWSAANGYSITSAAKNLGTTYAYLNEVLNPAVAASIATSLTAGVSVVAAVPKLAANLRDTYSYSDLTKLFTETAPMYANYPTSSTRYKTIAEVNASWEKLKSES